jgi:hypothetical protein
MGMCVAPPKKKPSAINYQPSASHEPTIVRRLGVADGWRLLMADS